MSSGSAEALEDMVITNEEYCKYTKHSAAGRCMMNGVVLIATGKVGSFDSIFVFIFIGVSLEDGSKFHFKIQYVC